MSINIIEQFAGYDVPETIKNATVSIMERFTITGLCDGMYIANTIAYVDGTGDGNGHFTSDRITNHEKIADRLLNCYGRNILGGDKHELIEMLATGKVNSVSSVLGLKKEATEEIHKLLKQDDNQRVTIADWEISKTEV